MIPIAMMFAPGDESPTPYLWGMSRELLKIWGEKTGGSFAVRYERLMTKQSSHTV